MDEQNVVPTHSNFHSSFSFVVTIGQFFGIMPLRGITSNNIQDVHFETRSLRFLYALYNFGGALFMAIACVIQFAVNGLILGHTGHLSFYVCNTVAALLFIHVAQKWREILKEAALVEMAFKKYLCVFNLKRRFTFITVIMMSLAIVEHLLFIASNLIVAKAICGINFYKYPFDTYFGVAFPSVFTVMDFSEWLAVITEIANLISTITWNFIDLFIILIGFSLASGFAHINERLEKGTDMKEEFWREVRQDYLRMVHLTEVIDECVCPLVMVSYVGNAYFVCVQLFNSFNERVEVMETVYYFFSLGFICARTIAVTLYGAWVHDESRRPLAVLHSVPSHRYCLEVQRFTTQISSSPVGITGIKCFTLTRGFLLKMASTIVFFEIMLLEFGPLTKDYEINDYTCIR